MDSFDPSPSLPIGMNQGPSAGSLEAPTLPLCRATIKSTTTAGWSRWAAAAGAALAKLSLTPNITDELSESEEKAAAELRHVPATVDQVEETVGALVQSETDPLLLPLFAPDEAEVSCSTNSRGLVDLDACTSLNQREQNDGVLQGESTSGPKDDDTLGKNMLQGTGSGLVDSDDESASGSEDCDSLGSNEREGWESGLEEEDSEGTVVNSDISKEHLQATRPV
jgi:hypothetical protein